MRSRTQRRIEGAAFEMAGNPRHDLAYLEGQTIGLRYTHNGRICVARSKHHRHLAKAIEAFVIQFDHHDFVVSCERILQSRWKWMNVAQVKVRAFHAGTSDASQRFAAWSPTLTPSHEQHLAGVVSNEFWIRQ